MCILSGHAKKNYTLSGELRDSKSGEALIGATIELYQINADNYDYYKTANNMLRNKKGPMASAAAPQANPITNISGGAVGYFCTFAVSRKVVVIK